MPVRFGEGYGFRRSGESAPARREAGFASGTMKSQRRHELKQNVLDAELIKALGFFRTHGKGVAWGITILALVGLVYVVVQRHAQSKEREAQADFNKLVLGGQAGRENLPQLDAIIEDDSNDFRAAHACVAAGDVFVNSVLAGGLTTQERADALSKAKGYYAKAIEKSADQPGAAAKA